MTLPRPEAPGPTLTIAKAGYTSWIFVAFSLSTLEGKTGLITKCLQLQAQVILASLSRRHKSAE
jgi:hypothetical protein